MALSQNLPMNFLAFLKIASISEVIWHYVGRKEQSSERFQISGSDLNFLCCFCHFVKVICPLLKLLIGKELLGTVPDIEWNARNQMTRYQNKPMWHTFYGLSFEYFSKFKQCVTRTLFLKKLRPAFSCLIIHTTLRLLYVMISRSWMNAIFATYLIVLHLRTMGSFSWLYVKSLEKL